MHMCVQKQLHIANTLNYLNYDKKFRRCRNEIELFIPFKAGISQTFLLHVPHAYHFIYQLLLLYVASDEYYH